ncbi:hypothetical protein HY469_04565 [Candidatus Roizmanbacteria bacterium]|nr:hypothetical protein [Candidatus Roizmanbacteria bacterium]
MFDRETRSAMRFVFWIGLTVIVLVVIASATGLITLPWVYNIEREAVQHSNVYVQSKVKELSDLKAQYERLEVQAAKYENNESVAKAYRSQQAAVVNQMWDAYDLIPQDIRGDVVPDHIRSFLSQHPRTDER